jgi:hypothetical protein
LVALECLLEYGGGLVRPAGGQRREGSLVVKAFYLEPGARRSRALDEAFDWALDGLRRAVGLVRVVR